MTTRYSGRFERFSTSPDVARAPDLPRDLLDEARRPGDSKPTPAETLARLLDTHHWLRVHKAF